MIILVVVVAALGLAVSLYGMMVERKFKKDSQYKAACDISDMVSCTKAFTSPYGKFLGISNIVIGLLYYAAMIFFGLIDNGAVTLILAWLGLFATIGFAYVLYFKVRTLCLICTSSYIINIALVVVQYVS